MRHFARSTAGIGILAFLAACGGTETRLAEPGAARGKSVLLVTVDTLRADHLGCYGHAGARTPVIDALAERGVRFERATTVSPITLPSHASIFTGLDLPNHGVRHNGMFRLERGARTLAELYAESGYDTAAFVSAFVLDRRYGLNRGFALYDDRFAAHDPGAGSYPERSADRVTDRFLEWLDARAAEGNVTPFFAWVHYFDPHGPYEPPAPFDASFSGSPYDGEIAFVDQQLGRLLGRIGGAGDTLVVLTADHGEGLGEHGEATHADLIYDSTMRVPLILSGAGLPAGTVVDDRLAATIDLFPTLAALSGLEHEPVDGIDLTGLTDPERTVYLETLAPLLDYGWAPLHGLRRYGDKFIDAPQPEYYDLDGDPGERVNLFEDEVAAGGLRVALAEKMSDWPEPFDVAGIQRDLTGEERRRLAALGYAAGAASEGIGQRNPADMMPLWHRINEAGRQSLAGDHEAAITTIRSVLREDPGNGKAWVAAMQTYDRAGMPAEAETCARRALELRPSSDLWVSLARYGLNRGDLATFTGALAEAERLDPDNGRVHLGHGYAEAKQGRYERAREEFETAARVDPLRCGAEAREQIARIDALLESR